MARQWFAEGVQLFEDGEEEFFLEGLQITEDQSAASADVTGGTMADGATETEVDAGTQSIIVTITGDTLNTFDASIEADIKAGCDADGAEASGWNAQIRDPVGSTMTITRDSATQYTISAITPDEEYNITANETVTVTVPASALVTSTSDLVCPTTMTITTVAAGRVMSSLVGSGGLAGPGGIAGAGGGLVA